MDVGLRRRCGFAAHTAFERYWREHPPYISWWRPIWASSRHRASHKAEADEAEAIGMLSGNELLKTNLTPCGRNHLNGQCDLPRSGEVGAKEDGGMEYRDANQRAVVNFRPPTTATRNGSSPYRSVLRTKASRKRVGKAGEGFSMRAKRQFPADPTDNAVTDQPIRLDCRALPRL